MKRITSALALAVGIASFAPACSKKEPPKPVEPTAKAPEPEPKPEPKVDPKPVEDAAVKAAEDAAVKPAEEVAAKPAEDVAAAAAITGEERVKKYQACWADFNAKNLDGFKTCFAPDFTDDTVDSDVPQTTGWDEFKTKRLDVFRAAFPDLNGKAQYIFQIGDHTIGVQLFSGTQTGVLKSAMGDLPASNKKLGLLVVHHVEWQHDAPLVKKQWMTMDAGTMLSQLGYSPEPGRAAIEAGAAEPTIVIAKGDEAEAALVANYKKEAEAFNKHDLAAAYGNLADKFVWSEAPMPADVSDKAALEAQMKGMFTAFSDLSLNPAWVGAAGNYVVAIGRFKGTNDGENPAMKMPKTGKPVDIGYYEIQQYDAGKIVNNWVFYNEIAIPAQLGLLGGGATK